MSHWLVTCHLYCSLCTYSMDTKSEYFSSELILVCIKPVTIRWVSSRMVWEKMTHGGKFIKHAEGRHKTGVECIALLCWNLWICQHSFNSCFPFSVTFNSADTVLTKLNRNNVIMLTMLTRRQRKSVKNYLDIKIVLLATIARLGQLIRFLYYWNDWKKEKTPEKHLSILLQSFI